MVKLVVAGARISLVQDLMHRNCQAEARQFKGYITTLSVSISPVTLQFYCLP